MLHELSCSFAIGIGTTRGGIKVPQGIKLARLIEEVFQSMFLVDFSLSLWLSVSVYLSMSLSLSLFLWLRRLLTGVAAWACVQVTTSRRDPEEGTPKQAPPPKKRKPESELQRAQAAVSKLGRRVVPKQKKGSRQREVDIALRAVQRQRQQL